MISEITLQLHNAIESLRLSAGVRVSGSLSSYSVQWPLVLPSVKLYQLAAIASSCLSQQTYHVSTAAAAAKTWFRITAIDDDYVQV